MDKRTLLCLTIVVATVTVVTAAPYGLFDRKEESFWSEFIEEIVDEFVESRFGSDRVKGAQLILPPPPPGGYVINKYGSEPNRAYYINDANPAGLYSSSSRPNHSSGRISVRPIYAGHYEDRYNQPSYGK